MMKATKEKAPSKIDEGQEMGKYLYDTVFPSIKNYVVANSGTTQDAQDIFQDALVIFFRKKSFGIDISCKVSTYLYSVAKILWMQQLMYKRRYTTTNVLIACEEAPEYEEYAYYLEKDSVQDLCEQIISKCNLSFSAEFMQVISSKDKKTRKLRWHYKQKIIKMIRTLPELEDLRQQVSWINC